MSNPAQYYCHSCAINLGFITPLSTLTPNVTGSNYQFGKYLKHTMPESYAGVLSIFNRPEYVEYQNFTVSGSLSGCCEVDSDGRTNLIWYAGRHIGMTFKDGKYYCPDDSIKVVLHHDLTLIHTFPINYELHYINRCLNCGLYIPT
jgi:hypothetical protein